VEAARHELRTAEGNPAEELLALARNEEVDLVAAGRRGHGPLHELLVGNVAEKLLQLAPCPLLLAH
jgi:nucleotide-binding universal stress UspA family protein